MKKYLVIFSLFLALSLNTFASDSKIKVGIGGGVSLPMGTFGDAYEMGFGGGLQGEYVFSENVTVTLATGYQTFKGKVGDSKFNNIPVLLGYKKEFGSLYGQLELGMNMTSADVTIPAVKVGGVVYKPESTTSASESKFGYGLGVGYVLSNFDLSLKYQSMGSDANVVNVGIKYVIGF